MVVWSKIPTICGFKIWLWDKAASRAVYVMHSAPKFPNVTEKGKIDFSLPSTAITFGQNFFCTTFKLNSLDEIGINIATAQLNIYYSSGDFTTLKAVPSYTFTSSLFTMIDGENISFLSKSPHFANYLYEGVIEPHYNASLMVESWGRPYQSPVCQPNGLWDSTNIDSVTFNNGDTWVSSQDHSKWAISFDTTRVSVACASDMNRMTSQISRGGSALCTTNLNLFNAFTKIVSNYDKCSNQETEINFFLF